MSLLKKSVNWALNKKGYEISKAKKRTTIESQYPEITPSEKRVVEQTRPYTMTTLERQWALIQSLRHVKQHNVGGDIVECGVWRGGNLILATLYGKELNDQRVVWGFDTFEGMSAPEDIDQRLVDDSSAFGKFEESQTQSYNDWCYCSIEDVKSHIQSFDVPDSNIKLIKGKCEDTLKVAENLPEEISILRLDTDWYESTRTELEVLYPRLSNNGVLIIDDYGHWKGAKKAVDEYFDGANLFMHRIDYTCRLIIKP